MTQQSVCIICKHVSSGCNTSPIKLDYQDALDLSMREFCIMLNKKMLEVIHKCRTFSPSIQDSNGSYPYDIIYSDDGENNINKKLPFNDPIPFIKFLSNQKKIYNIYNLSFYARDNSVYEPTYTNIIEGQAAEPENQCCVCFNSTTVSCSEFYSCGNNLHHICRQCYNLCRVNSCNRCPVCRAEPHACMTAY